MDQWLNGSILWIEQRRTGNGGQVCEVIYELEGEPDSLRQMEIAAGDLYAGARRGQSVAINPALKRIRQR